jgi:hypothetical protein
LVSAARPGSGGGLAAAGGGLEVIGSGTPSS